MSHCTHGVIVSDRFGQRCKFCGKPDQTYRTRQFGNWEDGVEKIDALKADPQDVARETEAPGAPVKSLRSGNVPAESAPASEVVAWISPKQELLDQATKLAREVTDKLLRTEIERDTLRAEIERLQREQQ